MRIFITGASGMLGSALMRHHATIGDKVCGYDVFSEQPSVKVGDIRDGNSLSKIMLEFEPDRVYHCAAMLGVKNTEDNPKVCREINEFGTLATYCAAQLAGARDFIFTSSSEVYGDTGSDAPIEETQPLKGDNVYAMSKIISENYLLTKKDDMRIVIARMFNCYGLGQVKQFFIPKAIDTWGKGGTPTIFGDPENKRCYLFAQDAARYLVDIANLARTGDVINVSSNEIVTLRNALFQIADAFDFPVVPAYEVDYGRSGSYVDRKVSRDIPNRVADVSKLQSITRYQAQPFRRGIKKVVRYRDGLRDGWQYSMEPLS